MTVEIDQEEGPWGFAAPAFPGAPHMEFFKSPRIETFEYDHDFDHDFQYKVEPKLKRLEYKIRALAPKIEIDTRNLERQIRKTVRAATRIVSL